MKQRLTHSRMHSFKTCRKKHWWEYEIGWRRDVDAKALRMGTAFHEGLDLMKQGFSVREAIESVRALYAVPHDAVPEYDWEIERETVESLLVGYEWRWREQRLEVLATEASFELPLRNPSTGASSPVWNLAGKIDGIVRLEDGRLAVLEHKTTSDPLDSESDYWRRLRLDAQISLYVWAAREMRYDVDTVLYDVIRKPTIRPEQVPLLDADGLKIVLDADGERVLTRQGKPRQTGDKAKGYELQSRPMTPQEWSAKLTKDVGDRPDAYFARQEIPRLDCDVHETLAEVWDLQQTIRDAQKNNRWYKTVGRDSCTWCSYFGLCSAGFDPLEESGPPEGFVKLEDVHPELKGSE